MKPRHASSTSEINRWFFGLLLVTLLLPVTAPATLLPNQVTSATLLAWYKADAEVTTSGGAVTGWGDAASASTTYDATQTTATRQPQLIPNASPNGLLPVIRFNPSPAGQEDQLVIPNNPLNGKTDFTIFFVAMNNSDGNRGTILGNRDSGVVGLQVDLSMDSTVGYGLKDNAVWYFNGAGGIGNSIRTTPQNSAMPNTFYRVSTTWDTGAGSSPLTVEINGTSQTLTPWSILVNDQQFWAASDPGLGIGFSTVSYSQDSTFSGDIAEIIFFNGVISPTERAQIEQYLDAKWFGAGPVPEPSVVALLLAGGLLLVRARRGRSGERR